MATDATADTTGNRLLLNLPLRARLAAAFVGIALFTLVVVSIATGIGARDSLVNLVGDSLYTRVEDEAQIIDQFIAGQVTSLRVLSFNQGIQSSVVLSNLQYPTNPASVRERLSQLDAEWRTAPDSATLVRSRVAEHAVARTLREYRALEPANTELIVADSAGGLVAASDRTSDYDQSDEEWWQVARRGDVFISQPIYDESSATLGLQLAVPILNPTDGAVIGVTRSTYNLAAIGEKVAAIRMGSTGGGVLVLNDTEILYGSEGSVAIDERSMPTLADASVERYTVGWFEGRERLLSITPIDETPQIGALGWRLVLYQDLAEALAPIEAGRNVGLLASLAAALLAVLLAVLVAERISSPLARLSAAAQAVARGDLSRRVGLTSGDEIGQLARSFDTMAAALEQRIAAEQGAQQERLRLQEEIIRVQRETLKELATPLIPLNDRVLLLPLVGSVNAERAEQIFQALLRGVAERRARRVVIDLTGIPAVDDEVAATLVRAAQGVRLLGAEVSLTGISAALARTLTELEVNLEQIHVYANLDRALAGQA